MNLFQVALTSLLFINLLASYSYAAKDGKDNPAGPCITALETVQSIPKDLITKVSDQLRSELQQLPLEGTLRVRFSFSQGYGKEFESLLIKLKNVQGIEILSADKQESTDNIAPVEKFRVGFISIKGDRDALFKAIRFEEVGDSKNRFILRKVADYEPIAKVSSDIQEKIRALAKDEQLTLTLHFLGDKTLETAAFKLQDMKFSQVIGERNDHGISGGKITVTGKKSLLEEVISLSDVFFIETAEAANSWQQHSKGRFGVKSE